MSLSLSYVQFSRCVRFLPGLSLSVVRPDPSKRYSEEKGCSLPCCIDRVRVFPVPPSLRLSASLAFPFFRFRVRRPQVTLRFLRVLPRKEVIQPHLPIRLPCYDFTPVTNPTLDEKIGFGYYRLPWCDGRCVQDPGTYSPRHADPRLLATPTSCGRVAAHNPNWDDFFEIRSPLRARSSL